MPFIPIAIGAALGVWTWEQIFGGKTDSWLSMGTLVKLAAAAGAVYVGAIAWKNLKAA